MTEFAKFMPRNLGGSSLCGPDAPSTASACTNEAVIVISKRPLERDCVIQSLKQLLPTHEICGYQDACSWEVDCAGTHGNHVILLCLGTARLSDEGTKDSVRELATRAAPGTVVVVGECDDTISFIEAIENGAAAYISSSASLEDAAAVIRLASVTKGNGVVMPREKVLALRSRVEMPASRKSGLEDFFTERQLDVAQALRRGAANKTIAYELDLCESTVKIHVRNIMRKLKATNRTQAAFRLSQIADGSFDPKHLSHHG